MLWKWNYETHEYEAFLIGENWNCKVIAELHETINCPHCGKEKPMVYLTKAICTQIALNYY